MALSIRDAVQENLKARIGLLAPTGGGKTFTMLKLLFEMKRLGMASKIGVIDTEHRSASKYKRDFGPFRVIEMEDDFSPEQYVLALGMLAEDGCDAVGIDSLTHAWAGKGGALELKDKIGKQKGFNDYTAWGPVGAWHNRLIEGMLTYPGHLIATMRLKMEHVLEEHPITKKKEVKKIGLQPVQRDGMEYEFDVVGDLDQQHNFSISKTRCSKLDGYSEPKPDGKAIIKTLKAWLESEEGKAPPPVKPKLAAAPEPAPEPPPAPPTAPPAQASGTAALHVADTYLDMIEKAANESALAAVGAAIASAGAGGRITKEERTRLRSMYEAKKASFAVKVA